LHDKPHYNTVADILIGIENVENVIVNAFITFNGGSCKHSVLVAVNSVFLKLPPYVSGQSLIIVGIDRYVAIMHPLAYETHMTYGVIKAMIAVAWTLECLLVSLIQQLHRISFQCILLIAYNSLLYVL